MFVMHFCSVCNMNKIGGVFVVYILVVAATGAADLKSTSQSKATSKAEQSSKSKEPVTAAKVSPIHHVSAHASVSHGMGVASIAGVESRNGRVSSISGVKFYPSAGSSKGNYIFKSSDSKMGMPLTITKQGDGVSGTIRIMPGSVSVSSSANSGSASASAGPKITGFDPWSTSFMKPMMNDIFFPEPFPAFPNIAYNTKMYEPKFQTIPEPKFQTIPEPKFQRIPEPTFPKISQPSFSRIQQSSFTPRSQDPWGNDMFKNALPQYDIMGPTWYYPTFNPYFNFW